MMAGDKMTADDDLERLVEIGLTEDVGPGDWTTLWTIPADRIVGARIVAKAAGVLAGTDAALATIRRVDPTVSAVACRRDGDALEPWDEIILLRGSARAILSAERLMLNFLQHLSGVATATQAYVNAVAGTGVRILDTRKTSPGMRTLEKGAVRAGGGTNHRFGLHDMILIKENHIRAAGGIVAAVNAIAANNTRKLKVEVEATNLEEVALALAAGVDRILFDNMTIDSLRAAVALVARSGTRTETEASGGVTLSTVREIAETGVQYISVGAITHSAPALDLSLLVDRDE